MFSDKWHYRFMEVAKLVSTWSKDTSTKTGAVVVGPDREIRMQKNMAFLGVPYFVSTTPNQSGR